MFIGRKRNVCKCTENYLCNVNVHWAEKRRLFCKCTEKDLCNVNVHWTEKRRLFWKRTEKDLCIVNVHRTEKQPLFMRVTRQSWHIPVYRGGDGSVVRAPDSWLKGRGFESLLELRENFVLQGRLSVLTLISVSVPPPCYHSSTWKIPVILPKVQVAGYS